MGWGNYRDYGELLEAIRAGLGGGGSSGGTATAAAPTYSEGATAQPLSTDLAGNLRVKDAALISAITAGDDTNLAPADVTTHATPGTWVQLLAASSTRFGASIQGRSDATGKFWIVQLDGGSPPSSGTAAGEIALPISPAFFDFPWAPKRKYWVRSDVASQHVSVISY